MQFVANAISKVETSGVTEYDYRRTTTTPKEHPKQHGNALAALVFGFAFPFPYRLSRVVFLFIQKRG